MKLKNVHPETLDWAEHAINRMNDLLDTDINELNPACLARILSICTGLSSGVCAQKLKEAGQNTNTIEDQIKTFYDNI